MSDIMAAGLLIGVLAALFWTPYKMALGIAKLNGDDITMGTKIACFIPIYNVIKAEKDYYGSIKLVTIATFAFIMSIIFKVVTWLMMHSNTTINLISTLLVLALFVFVLIANMIFVYTVIHESDALTPIKTIIFSIIYPIGQYYVGAYVATVVKNNRNREDTFKV